MVDEKIFVTEENWISLMQTKLLDEDEVYFHTANLQFLFTEVTDAWLHSNNLEMRVYEDIGVTFIRTINDRDVKPILLEAQELLTQHEKYDEIKKKEELERIILDMNSIENKRKPIDHLGIVYDRFTPVWNTIDEICDFFAQKGYYCYFYDYGTILKKYSWISIGVKPLFEPNYKIPSIKEMRRIIEAFSKDPVNKGEKFKIYSSYHDLSYNELYSLFESLAEEDVITKDYNIDHFVIK